MLNTFRGRNIMSELDRIQEQEREGREERDDRN